MGTVEREWVSLKEAAEALGISITTIRGWSRAGQLEMRETANGRFVDLAQVRDKAMGRPRGGSDRVIFKIVSRTGSQLPTLPSA